MVSLKLLDPFNEERSSQNFRAVIAEKVIYPCERKAKPLPAFGRQVSKSRRRDRLP